MPPNSSRIAVVLSAILLTFALPAAADYGPDFTHGRGAQGN
jgi:hypothetical protein